MEKHNYLCGALVERAYAEAGRRYAKPKEAGRAARRELHRVAGAFFSREEAKRAEKLLASWPEDGDEALARILSLHASTRERLPLAETDALYEQLFAICGRPARVLDLACGLNPVYLAARGMSVLGMDAHLGAVALVNGFAQRNGLDTRAVAPTCAQTRCRKSASTWRWCSSFCRCWARMAMPCSSAYQPRM